MPFTSVVAPKQSELTLRLVGEVRFALAAEAAQSDQLKPPQSAIGSSGSDSDRYQRTKNFSAEVRSPNRALEVLGFQFVMLMLFRSRLWAAVVGTGPAGTQRLPCRCAGSGVGAKYAPTPFTALSQAWHSHKLHGCTVARFGGLAQQHATNRAAVPVRAARPNPSLKRSANGRPPGPGRRYAVHFRQPGPGVLPSSPA